MSSDLRTELNAAENTTGWTTSGAQLGSNTDTGQRYQGSASIEVQHTNANNETGTTSIGGTRNLNTSTVYILIKDNLLNNYANSGAQIVLGDGTNRIGYRVGGNNAVGMPLSPFFACYKLDVSVIVATPGTFVTYAGSEANLNQGAITRVGFGSLHLAKAVGNVPNCFIDRSTFVANGSYALRINGGTVGTPMTMATVKSDDSTNGWGMIGNPIGPQYIFIAPTEWGNPTATADMYFSATNEQWYWLGGNAGGHTVGTGNFPFRIVGNSTDTESFVLTNVSIINTGTGANFDCSNTNVNTLEMDGCTMIGLATFSSPTSGGTSRFCTNTIFSQCGQITHNGANMSGSSVLLSTVAADGGALLWDLNSDPDTVMDGMTFSQGTNAHHAVRFGTNVPAEMTLRNCAFDGFSSTPDADGATFRFDDIGGAITLNLIGCTVDGSVATSGNIGIDDAAGVTVTLVISPVTTKVNVKDHNNNNLQFARVYLRASDGTGPLPFEDSVTITRSGTTATVSHTNHGLSTGNLVKIKGITDKTEDNNGTHQITVTGANAYTYQTTDSGSTSYTGSITSTGVIFNGETDSNGDVTDQRALSGNQPVTGFVRKSTSSPRYKTFPISGTINSTNGLTINVRLILDE